MKAQFEAMGLAVIVILVSLGMLALMYFSLDDDSNVASRYGNAQTAQNVIDALLDTSIEKCPLDYADLIEDAAVYQRDPCGNSTEKLKEVANTILNETLTKRGTQYEIKITTQTGTQPPQMLYTNSTCTYRQKERDNAGQATLTFYPAPKKALVTLAICYEGRK